MLLSSLNNIYLAYNFQVFASRIIGVAACSIDIAHCLPLQGSGRKPPPNVLNKEVKPVITCRSDAVPIIASSIDVSAILDFCISCGCIAGTRFLPLVVESDQSIYGDF